MPLTDRQTHTQSTQLYQQCRNSGGCMILWWGGWLHLPFSPSFSSQSSLQATRTQ